MIISLLIKFTEDMQLCISSFFADVNGNTVVQYLYDDWGKLINSYTGSVGAFVAQYNPFIYKSYYYDKETKLYYLNSRFYSPELKQFLTIDDINYLDESLDNMNLFSYCNNNPYSCYTINSQLRAQINQKKIKQLIEIALFKFL